MGFFSPLFGHTVSVDSIKQVAFLRICKLYNELLQGFIKDKNESGFGVEMGLERYLTSEEHLCSWRRPKFKSYHPNCLSRLSVAHGKSDALICLAQAASMYVVHIYTLGQTTHTHEIK